MGRPFFAFAAVCLLAVGPLPAELRSPKIGMARFPDGSVRSVYGLHSNFVVGSQLFAHSDAVSFSDKGGLISTNGYIQLVGPDGTALGEYESDETNPVLSVAGDLTEALAWLPRRHSIIRWNGSSFAVTEVNGALPGTVTSIEIRGQGSASLIAVTTEGVVFEASVALESGNFNSLSPLPSAQGYTFAQGSSLLFHDKKGLELESADGSTKTLPVPAADLAIERMGTGWLHLYSASSNQHWALHLNRSTSELSELPGVVLNTASLEAAK